jgi:hypothetical protein
MPHSFPSYSCPKACFRRLIEQSGRISSLT